MRLCKTVIICRWLSDLVTIFSSNVHRYKLDTCAGWNNFLVFPSKIDFELYKILDDYESIDEKLRSDAILLKTFIALKNNWIDFFKCIVKNKCEKVSWQIKYFFFSNIILGQKFRGIFFALCTLKVLKNLENLQKFYVYLKIIECSPLYKKFWQ